MSLYGNAPEAKNVLELLRLLFKLVGEGVLADRNVPCGWWVLRTSVLWLLCVKLLEILLGLVGALLLVAALVYLLLIMISVLKLPTVVVVNYGWWCLNPCVIVGEGNVADGYRIFGSTEGI